MAGLDSFLSRGYKAFVLHSEQIADVNKGFRAACESDPTLRAQAEIKLSDLDKVSQQCFVSRTQAKFLRQAL